jgi:hypothetical protein
MDQARRGRSRAKRDDFLLKWRRDPELEARSRSLFLAGLERGHFHHRALETLDLR